MRFASLCPLLLLASLSASGWAGASETRYFVHDTADDWAASRFDGVVLTNYGELKLGRRMVPITDASPAASVVYDVAATGDTIFAGTGPEGTLLRVVDGETQRFSLPDVQLILSVTPIDAKTVLVGTGGEFGRLLRVTLPDDADGEPEVETIFEADGVAYVWDVLASGDGYLVATGPKAEVYRVQSGEATLVFTADGEANVQALAGGEGSTIYAGTSPNGLIWSIDVEQKSGQVLFDAPAAEVVALVRAGNDLYAATASEGMVEPAELGGGRPAVPADLPGLTDDDASPVEVPPLEPYEPDPVPLNFQDELEPMGDVEAAQPPARVGRFSPSQDQFAEAEGSAVYRLSVANDTAGLVTGVLADGAIIHDLLIRDGELLVAVGASEELPGRILSLNLATGATGVLAVEQAAHATSLAMVGDGLVVGLSNPGVVASLAAGEADGTVLSQPLDAGRVSRFGTAQFLGQLPAGTSAEVRFRGGNTTDPDMSAAGWGEWGEWKPVRRFVSTEVSPSRLLQYELRLIQGESDASPVIERVRIAYEPPNLGPTILDVTLGSETVGSEPSAVARSAFESGQSASSIRTVSWEASDPDGDRMTYDVLIRRNRQGEFQRVATGLAESEYAWDAAATGEGLFEVQVRASDATSNRPGEARQASRVTEPFRVDLTPPSVGDLEIDANTLQFRVIDEGGIVAGVEYLRPGGDPATATDWQRAFAEDGIADSPSERFTIVLEGTVEGRLRVRAVDDSGNLAYTSLPLAASPTSRAAGGE